MVIEPLNSLRNQAYKTRGPFLARYNGCRGNTDNNLTVEIKQCFCVGLNLFDDPPGMTRILCEYHREESSQKCRIIQLHFIARLCHKSTGNKQFKHIGRRQVPKPSDGGAGSRAFR